MALRQYYQLTVLFLTAVTLFAPNLLAKGVSPRVQITVSVDWEGTQLDEENLQAMRNFRLAFPNVPLVHFLNAAYFTHPGQSANSALLVEKIRSVLSPQDELGLHIHGWKSLFEESGVAFKDSPSLHGAGPSRVSRDGQQGHDVPISEYSTDELRAVLRKSREVLAENGFNGLKSFRSGAWVAAPHVLEALAHEGFVADSSEVPEELIRPSWGGRPLHTLVSEIWPNATLAKQPYEIATPGGVIREFPDNGGLADYVRGQTMLEVFKANLAAHPGAEVIQVHFGFHQETAREYLPRIEEGLRLIQYEANHRHLTLETRTMTGAAVFRGKIFGENPLACLGRRLRGY